MTTAPTSAPSLPAGVDAESIRAFFPALRSPTVFFENAGGSQVPALVADGMRDYMLTSYVQLEAGYAESNRADATVEGGHAFANLLAGGTDTGIATLGPSCTRLMMMLADCYGDVLEPGDEVIVCESGHEANVGPWVNLARRGVTVRTWTVNPEDGSCPLEGLSALLTPRTKVVAVVHVSNLLGGIMDVGAVADLVHAVGARLVVDGVAYAPHRAIDVAAWNADWYAWSAYKVYGPHMAVLYGTHEAYAELTGPNHFFIPKDDLPYRFEPGGVQHEGCAALLALGPYLSFLAGKPAEAPVDRATVVAAFETMTALELPLQERLLGYLRGRGDVRIVGPETGDASRVATISFVPERVAPSAVSAAAHAQQIGIRHGHMYAHRLCTALGIDLDEGVVRVSMLHYNTMEEVERLIEVLDDVLESAG